MVFTDNNLNHYYQDIVENTKGGKNMDFPTAIPQTTNLENLQQQQQQLYLQALQSEPIVSLCQHEPLKPKEKNMFSHVKGFIEKHRDIIFTLGLVILVDHFLFKGALRERIKSSIEGVLKKVEDKMHKEE